ncbi:sensor domain-containing phosphodiesterase [Kineococcus xinjiangensis]|uniref:sensor domain-containing phosphodiesterase n=1 Tax=Kineococcus xinjiangensis TaxID=512762 RepID=UPI001304956C|nr:EAL domain-containing protein [Kineococcus xinjiangensis]
MQEATDMRRAVSAPGRASLIEDLERSLPELAEDFRGLARLAAAVGGGIGCVTLVTPQRLIVVASTDPAMPAVLEVPAEFTACARVVLAGQGVCIPDYDVDPGFADAPDIGMGHVRSYVGAPLLDPSGEVLGSVCVLGDAPGSVCGERVLAAVEDLARQGGLLLAERRRRTEQEAQRDVLEAVAAGHPLPDVLDRLARHVERLLGPEVLCSVLLLDEDGVTLRDGAAPSLPAEYREAIDGVRAGDCVGSCGTAVHRRETVVVTDIATDPKWVGFRDLAARHGLASCTSLPVLGDDGEALGTFALYGREPGRAVAADDTTIAGFRDLTRVAIERNRSARLLTRLATQDTVTGLLNRAAFLVASEDVLARRPAPGSVHAVLLCDVDRFKLVNDSLGHAAGDAYLASSAQALRAVLRSGDVISRFAGNAFAVVLPDVSPDTAQAVAERVVGCFARPVEIRGHALNFSASVGLTTTALSATSDLNVLLRDADMAVHHAKRAGRARVQVCDAALRTHAAAHLELDLALRDAVGTDEFHLAYQPEIDTATGELVGFEALLRWVRPGVGHVSPADFIPLAEESGLIVELGRRVLTDACTQLAAWRASHPVARGLTMWVNVSPHQLADPGFVETVAVALAGAGLPGAALGLEITETAVMADPAGARATLAKLRRAGVRIAIDDFGTGYSSLAILKALPVDVVKVDRSFVSGLGEDPSDTRLVAAIVSMAHALNLSVVAEGVEEERQHTVLQDLGCETSQGWLFGRPVPAAQVEAILTTAEAWSPR